MTNSKAGRPRKYPLLSLEVGQFIDVSSTKEAKSVHVSAKSLGYDIITRKNKDSDTVRVWRVA